MDGQIYTLADVRGPKGTLVVFICNHCPYVKASIDRIVAEAKAMREIGIGTIAIMPNDTATYRESFDNMKAFAAKYGLTFPYVIDETQQVARAYDAQCTPDFFGFNAKDELQYRGRLDASRVQPVANTRRDVFEAMKQIAETGQARGANALDGMFDQMEGLRATARSIGSGEKLMPRQFSLTGRALTLHPQAVGALASLPTKGLEFGPPIHAR